MSWYSNLLERSPILTKVVTSGLIAATGDVNCQYIVHMNSNQRRQQDGTPEEWFSLDSARTGRFGLLGALLVAPCIHVWYGLLGAYIPGSTFVATLARTAVDQLVFAPAFIPLFVGSLMTLEGKGLKDVEVQLRETYVDTLMMNWGIWVPAQMINFRFMPLKFQVLFSNVIGLVWNTYLSFKTR